jgi:uncharacterized protein (AIM24 family)
MSQQEPTANTLEICPWCRSPVDHAQMSCPACGAALKFHPRRDDSGWIELPAIKDMARLRVGASTCQIEGEYVPVVDFNLAAGDGVYFAHHVLLWRDLSVNIETLPIKGAARRLFAGLPVVMTEASGPGHIAFSCDVPGEAVAIPLQRGQSIHVREHAFVAATRAIAYDWSVCGAYFTTQSGNDRETHYPIGRFLDEFHAASDHGLLLLHGGGNVFIRELGPDEWLFVKPTSFLFKDPSVRIGMITDTLPGAVGYQSILWLQLAGPGRIGIQSAYPPMEGAHQPISSTCGRVSGSWEGGHVAASFAAISGNRGNRARELLTNSAANLPLPQPPQHQQSPTDYRVAFLQIISEAMVNGEISAEAMSRLEMVASERGLSPYDLRMLINHVKAGRHGDVRP